MYFIANSTVHDEDAAYLSAAFLTQQTQRPQVGNINWTWTPNSRWVNEAQFGGQYLLKPSFVGDHTVNPTTYGLNTGITNPLYFGMPQISITGRPTFTDARRRHMAQDSRTGNRLRLSGSCLLFDGKARL